MSGRKLATYVHVADEHDAMHVFGPDDTVPDWAAKKIVNPKAWQGGKAPTSAEDPTDELVRLRAKLAELEAGLAAAQEGHALPVRVLAGVPAQADGPPPKGGAGSGAPAWREYAASKGVEVAEDASREDVIAALTDAGIPTE